MEKITVAFHWYWRSLERTASTPGPTYCSRCGASNSSGSTYCSGCGAMLNP